jgi:hypothetical protein
MILTAVQYSVAVVRHLLEQARSGPVSRVGSDPTDDIEAELIASPIILTFSPRRSRPKEARSSSRHRAARSTFRPLPQTAHPRNPE